MENRDRIITAKEFCEMLDNEQGEAWSNAYDELAEQMGRYAEYYHNEKVKDIIEYIELLLSESFFLGGGVE